MQNVVFPVIPGEHTVSGPRQGEWTEQDWEGLPHDDGNRYEIVDGILYMSTSPSYFHQYIIFQFVRLVGTPAFEKGLAHVIFAPVGLFLPGGNPVQPDLVIIRKENEGIIHDRRIRGVPDLVVEVLSPGNVQYDEDTKQKLYARAGIPEYVVVDPVQRQLRLYTLLEAGGYREPRIYNADATVEFASLPTISLRVGALFKGSPDTTL